jgi:hypothetical protein
MLDRLQETSWREKPDAAHPEEVAAVTPSQQRFRFPRTANIAGLSGLAA